MLGDEIFKLEPEIKCELKHEPSNMETENDSNFQNLFNTNRLQEPVEPPDRKRRKADPLKSQLTALTIIMALLITVATGAQIGTSHKKISITRICATLTGRLNSSYPPPVTIS